MERDKSTIWLGAKQSFNSIKSERAIYAHGLTLSSYFALAEVMRSIAEGSPDVTVISDVADWCRENGLTVQEDGVGWKISC